MRLSNFLSVLSAKQPFALISLSGLMIMGSDASDKRGIPLLRAEGLIIISDTPKGRGVFADRHIPANTILDVCPVLVLDPSENEIHIRKTELYNYTYNWPYRDENQAPKTTQALVLGLGSLFNHSTRYQNVGWVRDEPNRLVSYKTLRDIARGEELCISYGDRLTFTDTDAKITDSDDESSTLSKIKLV